MKAYAKIRLAVLLCIMMVLPSIVSVLPMTAQEVSAAQELYIDWYYSISQHNNTAIQIEKGVKFNIGDYAYISDKNSMKSASLFSNVKYSSSKTSVASVNSKGVLTAKKTGTTTIKIKYKGKSISQKFKVVKKGSLTGSTAAKRLQKVCNKLTASVPKKITTSNALKYTKINNTYNQDTTKYSSDISAQGFLMTKIKIGNMSYPSTSCKLAVPDAGRFNYLRDLLYQYSDKNSPTSTRSSKVMKISSVSASTKQITIKLKKAITADHILAANIENSYYNNNPNKNSVNIRLSIMDKTTNTYYTGYTTLKKGSKTIKIKLKKSTYINNTFKEVSYKLQKGHSYAIGAKNIEWGNGKTVKCK